MLTISASKPTRTCEGITRRELLKIGTCAIGGFTLPQMFALDSAMGGVSSSVLRNKSIVVLNLQGGPTHIETFDPKMTAPQEYRAMFGEVQTSVPGVTLGSHFEHLSAWADRMAIVRSYRHGISSHATAAAHVISGGNPTKAMLGAVYSRIAGVSNPQSGIPNNVVLPPGSVDKKYKNLGAQTTRLTATGSLGDVFKPFDPSAGGEVIKNMELKLKQDRFDDRRELLTQLDHLRRNLDNSDLLSGADQFQQQAFEVLLGGIGEAFNLSEEDPKLVQKYSTMKLDIPKSLYKKKNKNLLRQSPISLGHQMLLARRLVEAGARFVTVTSAGWDMHGNAFGIDDGMPILGRAVDRAASAFLEDIEQRGLFDDVLLVITGEFGRTPRINKKGGRDHWGNLCTLALAGGGYRMGQVIGASDRTASRPATEPVTSQQLMGTLMHLLIDSGQLRLQSQIPLEIRRMIDNAAPIPQLLG